MENQTLEQVAPAAAPTPAKTRILSAVEAQQIATMTPKATMAGFQKFLAHNMEFLEMIAPDGFSAKRLVKSVIGIVMRQPDLMECTIQSLFNAAAMAAETGLSVSGPTGQACIVAYNKNVGSRDQPKWQKEAQFQSMYRGMIDLARRSGEVRSVRAKVVYQGDHFEYRDGLTIILDHVPDLAASRDVKFVTFAWCVIQLDGGGMLCDVMSRAEVDAIRARSKTGSNGPWVTDYAEMAKKTVCRRCLKYAPMSVEMTKAQAADDALETGDFSMLAEFDCFDNAEQPELPSKTSRVKDKIADVPVAATTPEPTETGEGEK